MLAAGRQPQGGGGLGAKFFHPRGEATGIKQFIGQRLPVNVNLFGIGGVGFVETAVGGGQQIIKTGHGEKYSR